tara:strand:- start:1688 stop:2521 length:834 start_codon:yes stop_codon:yes gene_type:complete
MNTLKEKLLHYFIISIFCSLYFLVATISMINSVAFFDLTHSGLMSWSLAIGFEIGAAASLAAIIILDKTNKTMVWGLFLLLTSFQMMANSFHAFINLENYIGWIQLFGLEEAEVIEQKRILSIVSGAILPVVALGFIKSLVDYIRPTEGLQPELKEGLQPELKEELQSEPTEVVVPKEESVVKDIESVVVTSEPLVEENHPSPAIIAAIPVEVGSVHVEPDNTAGPDIVESPTVTENTTTAVGDPLILPGVTVSSLGVKTPLGNRPFVRSPSINSKP